MHSKYSAWLVILFLVSFVSLVYQPYSVITYSATKAEVDGKISEINNTLSQINTDFHDVKSRKATLQEELKSVNSDIENTEKLIKESESVIVALNQQIATNKVNIDSYREQMKFLLRDIQKQDSVTPIQTVLASRNLGEALSKMYTLSSLQSKADELKENLESETTSMEENAKKQAEVKKQLEGSKSLLESKKSEVNNLITNYSGKEEEYASKIAELKQLQTDAEAQSKELEKQALDRIDNPTPAATRITPINNPNPITAPVPSPTRPAPGDLGGLGCWFEETASLGGGGYFVRPVATGYVSQGRGFSCGHDGVDIPNPVNTPIVAAASGVVQQTGYHIGGYGYHIIIRHDLPSGQRVYTLYAHMNTAAIVGQGAAVSAGQQIGYVGSTGYSTGPHLHFSMLSSSFEYTGNSGCMYGTTKCYRPERFVPL